MIFAYATITIMIMTTLAVFIFASMMIFDSGSDGGINRSGSSSVEFNCSSGRLVKVF
jgi:hypothetical protein